MRNLKRVLSLALALVMVLGMMVITTSAATFADADEITNTEAVEVLAKLGIVQGDGTNFNPNGTFTREAAAKLITYMLIGDKMAEKLAGTDVFTDVAADRWSAKYIGYCANLGYITGNGDGTFNPDGELTDIALGKLVLCAIGYADPAKYTGANWASAVTVDMLEAGLVDVVTGTTISREDACALILGAMKYTTAEKYWTVTKGTATYEFDNQNDALLYKYMLGADAVVAGPLTDYSDTLLSKVYKVSCTDTPDNFGRPATTYTKQGWTAPMVYTETPVATFNTAMSEKELFAALGATGIQGASDKYVVMDKIYINGNVEGEAEKIGTTNQYQGKGTGSANGTVIIAKNDRSNIAGFGNGVTVELYATTVPNHYVMISYNEYVGEVASVIEEDADKGIERAVVISGVGSFVTDEFEEDDVVLYTVAKGQITSMVLADTLTGTVSKITSEGVYTIDGKEYVLSQNYAGAGVAVTGLATYWYVDSCGNIIDNGAGARPASWNYGYLIDYAWSAYDDADLLGDGADENAEKFQIIGADGKKVVLNGAFVDDNENDVLDTAERVAATIRSAVAAGTPDSTDSLVRYKLNADGEIATIEEIGGTTGATGKTADYTKGTAKYDGKYVTDDTVVIVYKDDTARGVAVYNGYKNIPGDVTVTSADYFYAEKVVNGVKQPDNTTIAAVVMTVADLPAATTKAAFVYFASSEYVVSLDADADTIYTYTDVYLDGVKGELTFTSVQGDQDGQLYLYTTNGRTGYASLSTHMGDIAQTATVKSIQSGYYVTDHSSVQVIYTDADTVYYQVDKLTGAVTEAEGLPALSTKYAVEQICVYSPYLTMDQDNPATIVYFTVVK